MAPGPSDPDAPADAVTRTGGGGVSGSDRPVFVVLAEGSLGLEASKTAASVIRYVPERVTAVLDSEHAGESAADTLGIGEDVPVVAGLEEALGLEPRPDALLIGVAPQGGALPEAWRPLLRAALREGLDLWSGLHAFLADDPELAELAEETGGRLVDLRRPPPDLEVATGRAGRVDAHRVLTVGTDCNVGKMTATMELRRALRRRGLEAAVAATGQTGIVLEGGGIAVDAVVSDFTAGAAERLVLEAAETAPDLVLVEGQGSLLHPGYSGVTLGLLHGTMPQSMVLCWMPGRPTIYGGSYDWVEIPPLDRVVELYEDAASWVRPPVESRVVAVSATTYDLSEAEARRAVERAREVTGLPATDPIRFGPEPLAEAVAEDMDRG